MIVGYLDNSQTNISIESQRDIINQYARDNACPIDIFLTEPDIKNIKDNINSKENTIIVANIACLGNKLTIITENIESMVFDGFTLVTIKETTKVEA